MTAADLSGPGLSRRNSTGATARDAAAFALHRPSPPHNLEAEQALLGCLMMSGDVLDAIDGLVSADTFSEPYHQLVFGELATMIRGGRRPDPTLVMDSLKLSPAFDEFGGLRYLADLIDRSPPVHTARETLF